jgi:hypothetical protein
MTFGRGFRHGYGILMPLLPRDLITPDMTPRRVYGMHVGIVQVAPRYTLHPSFFTETQASHVSTQNSRTTFYLIGYCADLASASR